jgi:hypothetical protein
MATIPGTAGAVGLGTAANGLPEKAEFGGNTALAAVTARCCCPSGNSLKISLAMRAN